MRMWFITIPGQEILSSDGVTIKISLAAQYEISDPEIVVSKTENFQEALYLIVQLALREIVGSETIDDVLQKRKELSQKLMELTVENLKSIGINLISISIKDIMFPGELKNIFAQEVKARKEGIAILERTRGETAALRNLLNVARMVQENPILLQLRALESSGNTIVFNIGVSNNQVLPIKKQENI